jgi:hypothetical protein
MGIAGAARSKLAKPVGSVGTEPQGLGLVAAGAWGRLTHEARRHRSLMHRQ